MRGSKDAALGIAARRLINSRLHALGEITDLTLDTSSQTMHLRVALRGENDPVEIDVRKYDIQRSPDGVTLTVVDAVTTREWLTGALHEFALGHPFEIPSKAIAVMSPLLTS